MTALPSATLAFLFTDIEGCTRLWEEYPEQVPPALARHDVLLRDAIETNGGTVFKTVGDSFCAVFPTAETALRAAIAAQQSIAEDQSTEFTAETQRAQREIEIEVE